MIELALPAGTLENALVAFNNGADAVYFGMKEFSARKGAGNFSFEDLAKIRKYSLDNNKKIYITINTLIDDETLPALYQTVAKVAEYGCDGVICQDLGVARLIKNHFPSLPLHASTQLAVHTIQGVKVLQEIGFERVVLSRELNLSEIKAIREACPDVEIKVFIHGALCYGFSGLCMASRQKTGRSANEGACAQVCRTWFTDLSTGKKLYPFSLEDMEAGKLVKSLNEIGIDSLKVEGRLKGNEYVAAVASYYRAIIDNTNPERFHGAVQSSFQRISGPGYLNYTGPGHQCLNTGDYTGHFGEYIGEIVATSWNSIKIKSTISLNPYDGLLILAEKPVRISCRILKTKGSYTTIAYESDEKVTIGDEIRRISNSSLKERKVSTDIPFLKPLRDIALTITDDGLEVDGQLYNTIVADAEKDGYKSALEKIFRQTGENTFDVNKLSIKNLSSHGKPFLRSSELKKIRREVYITYDQAKVERKVYTTDCTARVNDITLPDRKLLSSSRLDWNIEGVDIDGYHYITIPPVTYAEDRLFKSIEESAKRYQNCRIGLNNIAHVAFAKAHPEYEYFADIYLYLSNRESALLLQSIVPNLIGGYLWIERTTYQDPWPFKPTVEKDFKPPLFISRSCYRHDSLGMDCKGCSRHHDFAIEQNGEIYSVFVDDCQTVVKSR